jgi:hypothetical protein
VAQHYVRGDENENIIMGCRLQIIRRIVRIEWHVTDPMTSGTPAEMLWN